MGTGIYELHTQRVQVPSKEALGPFLHPSGPHTHTHTQTLCFLAERFPIEAPAPRRQSSVCWRPWQGAEVRVGSCPSRVVYKPLGVLWMVAKSISRQFETMAETMFCWYLQESQHPRAS